MEVYLVTILILTFFSILEIKYNLSENIINFLILIVFLLLIVQVGFRWETGTDWQPYLTHFGSINEISDIIPSILIGFEPGYTLFVFLLKLICTDYTFFLFVHSLIYYSLILISFRKVSPFFFITILLFYCSTLGYLGSNRQLLAIAICFTSLPYIVNKKPIQFSLIILLAISFHLTAIIFFIFYFCNFKIKPHILLSALLISIIIGYTSLPIIFFSNLGNYIGGVSLSKSDFYINNSKEDLINNSLSFSGIIKRLLLLFIFYFNAKKLSKLSTYYNLIFNGFFIGILIYFIFSKSLLIIVNRGSLYFSFLECILISCQFLVFRNFKLNFILFIFYLFYSLTLFWQSISSHYDLFVPYKGLYYNSSFNRDLY